MKRPARCICRHPDARECLARRYPEGVDLIRDDERCECGCHSEDEDGRSGWDDERAEQHDRERAAQKGG
jgi:hypothetical protein